MAVADVMQNAVEQELLLSLIMKQMPRISCGLFVHLSINLTAAQQIHETWLTQDTFVSVSLAH